MPILTFPKRPPRPVSDWLSPASGCPARVAGFTLVELLAVMAILIVLVALMAPAMNAIKGGRDTTQAAYDLVGALETARTYALANNTYVWVGFFEEDGSQASANPAVAGKGGRVVVSIVASKDGTRYANAVNAVPPAFGDSTGTVALVQLNKLLKIKDVHLAALNDPSGATNAPPRPPVPTAYQVGDASAAPNNTAGAFALTTVSGGNSNPVTFTYPVPPSATQKASNPQYLFTKIIEFNPQGEASKITENTYGGAGPQSFLEIALQPTHGNTVDPSYASTGRVGAAIQIEGLTGQVKVYRP